MLMIAGYETTSGSLFFFFFFGRGTGLSEALPVTLVTLTVCHQWVFLRMLMFVDNYSGL